jgi:flagellar basal-body rod protein FlgB
MDLIDSQSTRVVAKALDGVSKRHEALVSNIANAETPGYQNMEVSFEENLKEAIEAENDPQKYAKFLPKGSLKTSDPRHVNPHPVPDSTASARAFIERSQFMYRYDQNGVDIEKSMSDLARNTERYMALSKLEGRMFNSLKSVINGGGS